MSYSFKFIERDIPYIASVSLDAPFQELHDCLESEGIILDMDDIVKLFDIYLRIKNLGKSKPDDPYKGLFNAVELSDIGHLVYDGELILEGEESINRDMAQVITLFNSHADFKFYNEIAITSHIYTITKEFDIFINDIVRYIYKEYTKYSNVMGLVNFVSPETRDGVNVILSAYKLPNTLGDNTLILGIVSKALFAEIPDGVLFNLSRFTDENQKKLLAALGKDNA